MHALLQRLAISGRVARTQECVLWWSINSSARPGVCMDIVAAQLCVSL